ncbi:MAG: NUDIX domain-containing protein [Burkholderiales bacterium]
MDGLQGLRARADQPPLVARDPLRVASSDSVVGSVEPTLAARMAAAGLPIAQFAEGWRVTGTPLDAALARVAEWLRGQGLASAWRNELLSVNDASGTSVAMIERAAVRPLGIATQAVHLVGWAEQGGVWVQQRALDKATDPGQWDTLMGGLVSATESIATTLARETWEEVGLHVDQLRNVAECGPLIVRRPVSNGYMIEHIHVFEAVIPVGLVPLNQDGEVAAFERLDLEALQQRLHAGAFTLEAALILADCLSRHLPQELR